MVEPAHDLHLLEVVEQRRALVPGHPGRAVDHVVALERAEWDEGEVLDVQRFGEVGEVGHDPVEHALVPVHEVHLVHAHHHVRDPQQRGDVGVALGLLDHAGAGIDQLERQVGRRGPGDHVARVLLVAGRVGDDELALGGLEVAVGDVDGDALLALGPQAVGEQRQVHVAVAAALGDLLHVRHLVGQHLLRVEQQPADQRALAVVDRARGGEPEQLRGCFHYGGHPRNTLRASGPPSPPSVTRSSARVSPRSVMRVAAISATTSSSVAASRSARRRCSSCRRRCGSARRP